MKTRFWISLLLTLAIGVGISLDYALSASAVETTYVFRVRSLNSIKPVSFTGTIQFDSGRAPISLNNQQTPYGIKISGTSVLANIQKAASGPDLYVELIEFKNEKEVSSVSKTGEKIEALASISGSESKLIAK